jgi:putative transposase
MKRLRLVVKQRIAYNVTTKRKHSDAVADNLLNMNFNQPEPSQVCPRDISYVRSGEGWQYLAVVIDLCGR